MRGERERREGMGAVQSLPHSCREGPVAGLLTRCLTDQCCGHGDVV